MAGSGGKRPGAGRKQGVPNKVTLKREKELAAGGLMPLDYMLRVLRDEEAPVDRRDWASEKAAPYCHPRLTSVEHKGEDGGPIQTVLKVVFVKPPNADP